MVLTTSTLFVFLPAPAGTWIICANFGFGTDKWNSLCRLAAFVELFAVVVLYLPFVLIGEEIRLGFVRKIERSINTVSTMKDFKEQPAISICIPFNRL